MYKIWLWVRVSLDGEEGSLMWVCLYFLKFLHTKLKLHFRKTLQRSKSCKIHFQEYSRNKIVLHCVFSTDHYCPKGWKLVLGWEVMKKIFDITKVWLTKLRPTRHKSHSIIFNFTMYWGEGAEHLGIMSEKLLSRQWKKKLRNTALHFV